MRELSLEEIHKHSLGCLVFFDSICKKYGLKYTLAYGSLIGAIRHKGFIPWDDDVDVMMLRKDYDKLERLFLKNVIHHDYYRFVNEKTSGTYYYLIGRIIDTRTRVCFSDDYNYNDIEDMGVFMDIYPLDDFPSSQIGISFFSSAFKKIVGYLFLANSKGGSNGNIKLRVLYIFSKLAGTRFGYFAYRLLRFFLPYSDFSYDIWTASQYVIPKVWFDDYIEMDFEGKKMHVLAEYDALLRCEYGDYMKLPNKEDRVPTHSYRAFSIHERDEE